ncbi:hypothetical protein GQ43DRAFT_413279 [Delitschia confertaspora ATCC 74209]|uniref:25S rRNA (uridine-N(3))-methyltransferase BMT5-like domain-containing protein n=1 Tax=Delitschia confertaspora ATCC 74209 TaxID=1513339 RepID=A0A9P4JSW1_9PLEO|nr:hypothetical protein GQ43DRAFT_413279 [Delitschia confertaspora ATCC 74209]
MSKTKAKRARREQKRDGQRKAAAHQRKALKSASKPATSKPATSKPASTKSSKPTAAESQAERQRQRLSKVPFGEYDNILLVGEGDFSFAHSIVTHHGCANVTATSFDSLEEVHRKYPQSPALLSDLSSLTPPVPLHHSIDATKLHTYRCLRPSAPYSHIIFNFPHTGGLSKDVNRQVRANQSLLVQFFESVTKSHSQSQSQSQNQPQSQSSTSSQKPAESKPTDSKTEPPKPRKTPPPPLLSPGGHIVLTLFEGEPYTLWNVRDLARHAGLRVLESFKFDWSLYPGYSHVRTLGKIEGDGGWKGEEREARCFVFERPEEEGDGKGGKGGGKGKKRGREESSSDEGSDSEGE